MCGLISLVNDNNVDNNFKDILCMYTLARKQSTQKHGSDPLDVQAD